MAPEPCGGNEYYFRSTVFRPQNHGSAVARNPVARETEMLEQEIAEGAETRRSAPVMQIPLEGERTLTQLPCVRGFPWRLSNPRSRRDGAKATAIPH
jgi:hypothetical protein